MPLLTAIVHLQILHGTPGYINLLDALNAWCACFNASPAARVRVAQFLKQVSRQGAQVGHWPPGRRIFQARQSHRRSRRSATDCTGARVL